MAQILSLAADDQTHHRERHLDRLSDRLRNVVLIENGSDGCNDRIGRRSLRDTLEMRHEESIDSVLLRQPTSQVRLREHLVHSTLRVSQRVFVACGDQHVLRFVHFRHNNLQ